MSHRTLRSGVVLLLVAASGGCGSTRVIVPPRIDLHPLEVIGIIEFTSSNRGRLGPLATQRFLEAMRRDQGMVRIVELGPEAELLRNVGRSELDRDALVALGEKHGVSTIITGALSVTDVKPAIRFAPGRGDVGVAADVDATLTARIVEAASGASLWNRSASATRRVAHVSVFGGRDVAFDADDPDRAYGDLLDALVEAVTTDFRVGWERR